MVGAGGLGWPGAGLAAACLGLSAWPQLAPGTRVVALIGASSAATTVVTLPPIWPLAQLAVGLPAFLAVLLAPGLREGRAWLARGRFDPLPMLALGALAGAALLLWWALARPDLSSARAMVPAWPLAWMVAAAIGFSVANAWLEELVFRGLLQGALSSVLGDGALAIVLQGAAFGAVHWHGIPSGPIGALLAGSWGVMLGWARRRTSGLLTPVLAHVAADAVIFTILAWLS